MMDTDPIDAECVVWDLVVYIFSYQRTVRKPVTGYRDYKTSRYILSFFST
jgi:hypothetical protein